MERSIRKSQQAHRNKNIVDGSDRGSSTVLVQRGHCKTLKIFVDLLEFREQGQAEPQIMRDCGRGLNCREASETQTKTNECTPILDRVVDAAVLTWSSATMCPQTQKQNSLANGWERGPLKCTQ